MNEERIIRPLGHDKALETFLKVVEKSEGEGRSFLFYGPRGVGKFTSALYLYASLVCTTGRKGPCGVCRACRLVARKTWSDLQVIEPSGKGGQITVDQVREFFISATRFRPLESPWRMIIVDDAHAMNTSAQNSALKVLEEPPAGTIFVLITPNPWALLPTVRSRTVDVYFGPLSFEDFKKVLQLRGVAVSEREYLMSGGSPGFYLQIINDASGEFADAWELAHMLEEGRISPFKVLDIVSARFKDQASVTSFLNSLRWVILQKIREKVRKGDPEAEFEAETWMKIYEDISRWRLAAQTGQAFTLIGYEMALRLKKSR